jgi:hypothetical protein
MNLGRNMGGVEREDVTSFAPNEFLPVGRYKCKVIDVKWKRSKNKGTPYLNLLWQCVEGDQEGKVTFEQKFYTEGTVPYFKGWSEQIMLVMLSSHLLNEQLYKDRYAMVMVKGEDFNGKTVHRAQSFYDEDIVALNHIIDGKEGANKDILGDVSQEAEGDFINNGPSDEDIPPPGDEDLPF